MLPLAACALVLTASLPAYAAVGKDFDLQGFIDTAVKAGQKHIVVPAGVYRVKPTAGVHLSLANLHDIEIDCSHVEMICTQTVQAVHISRCRNLVLKGLTIDYDPLPFTEGKITALTPDKKVADVALFDGYPGANSVTTFKYEVYRPDTHTLRQDLGDASKVDVMDERHIRLTAGGWANAPMQVGDIVTIGTEYPAGARNHAVVIDGCVNLKLEDITLYASPVFGFLENGCDRTTYLRCKVDRCPPAADIVQRAYPRMRSLDADAFHSAGAVKGPALIDCVARFMGDDAINIHGFYDMVTACNWADLRVLINGSPLQVGDPLELLTYQGVRLPDATVTKVQVDGNITPDEHAFIAKQHMYEHFRVGWNPVALKITLDRPVDLPMGSLVCCTRRVGNEFMVKGCHFGPNRSRGILIKASNGQVIGNYLTGNWGEAIKVSPEYFWLEAGSSIDVTIQDNTISNCRAIPIAVYANGGAGAVAPAGAHRNITITGNKISDCGYPGIAVTSTDGLVIEGNTVGAPAADKNLAGLSRFLGLDVSDLQPIMTSQCAHAIIKDNHIAPAPAPASHE
jgi:parallel beta-helix repeat protein